MDWTLEVVVMPVSDVERAKAFYVDRLGFALDLDDTRAGMRIVQTTPPGSYCSVTFGAGLSTGEPGSAKGMQLCVSDIQAAREHLVSHGVECSTVRHVGDTGWEDGPGGRWNSFLFFDDPDGNSWVVQEKPSA